MKYLKKIDHNYIIIIAVCAILLFLVVPENCIFGSQIDWVSQHVVFPDYFRKLFYKTGDFFPNFALSIGGGQNIYNFSYYGLLNPLILFSYLLPFLSMKSYIIILNAILYIGFGLLFYYFIKPKTEKKTALITTLILIMASPILFHFHKHFMFVNYLPFLMLALIGVDRFFKSNKKLLLTFSIFMIIMISYYYSVCCIAVVGIYAIYKYLQENKKIEWKAMFKKGCQFLFPIIVAVMMSAVLILPTFFVLLNGRGTDTKSIEFVNLLFPNFNLDALLYSTYSMGLTFISLLGILTGLTEKKKERKFLSYIIILILIIPVFIYLLNGTLYIRDKILIPLIPLIGIISCHFIDRLLNKKIDFIKLMLPIIIVFFTAIGCGFNNPAFYLDAIIITLLLHTYYHKKGTKNLFLFGIVLVPIITVLIANSTDVYMSKDAIAKNDNREIKEAIKNTLKEEKDLVRFNHLENNIRNVNEVYTTEYNQDSLYSSVSNNLYKEFYEDIFNNALSYRNNLILPQNNDILFQTFMGVKYIYSKKQIPIGYEKVGKNVYKNNNVLPMIYGTNQITNEKEFDKLAYPYNIGVLLNSVVTKGKTTNNNTPSIQKIKLEYEIEKKENLEIKEKEDYLQLKTEGAGKLVLNLKESLKKDVLIINVSLLNRSDCKEGDLRMSINGIDNVLTCKQWIYKNDNTTFHYVISSNQDLEKLTIKLSSGVYKVKEIEVYKLDYSTLTGIEDNLSKFEVNQEKTLGDTIEGIIDMKNTGYLATSIPYDKGFEVLVDGQKVKTEIVNKAFLGFSLKEGKHTIQITYHAPYFKQGLIISMIGVVGFLGFVVQEKLSKKKKKNKTI